MNTLKSYCYNKYYFRPRVKRYFGYGMGMYHPFGMGYGMHGMGYGMGYGHPMGGMWG